MIMMNTKKYTLIWMAWLVCVGVAAFFMIRGSQLPNTIDSPLIPTASDMFSLVPWWFDQLVYIRVDEELAQSVTSIPWLDQLVSRVDSALISQYTLWEDQYSLLFLEWEQVDINELQQLWLIVQWEQYVSKQINNKLWIYGTQAALDWQETSNSNNPNEYILENFIKQFTVWNYNLWVLSSPNSANKIPILQQFSDKLLYTSIMTRLANQRTTWQITLQFADAVIQDTKWIYESKLDTFVSGDTLLYIEMKDMLSFLGVDEQQFLGIIPILLWQYGNAYTALLSNEQYVSLWETFEDNVGIFVGPSSDSMLGMWVSFVFSDEWVFDLFSTLAPVRYDLIQWVVGSGSVSMQKEQNSIVYSSINTGWVAPIIFAEISKEQDMAEISILWWWIWISSWVVSHMPGFVDNTAMVLRADLWKLSMLSSLAWAWQVPSGMLSAGQGVLVWDVQISEKEQQITFSFSVKQ